MKRSIFAGLLTIFSGGVYAGQDLCSDLRQGIATAATDVAANRPPQPDYSPQTFQDVDFISLAAKVEGCLPGWTRTPVEEDFPSGDVTPVVYLRAVRQFIYSRPGSKVKVNVRVGPGAPPAFLSKVYVYIQ